MTTLAAYPRRRPVVYVSGAISDPDPTVREANVRRGIAMCVRLRAAGYATINPFLTALPGCGYPDAPVGSSDYEVALAVDLSLIGRADALLRLKDRPGKHSRGAERECAHAQAIGVPIYHSIDDLRDALEAGLFGPTPVHRHRRPRTATRARA